MKTVIACIALVGCAIEPSFSGGSNESPWPMPPHDEKAVETTCEQGASCDVVDSSCIAGDQRCECRWTESGTHLYCEALACPEPSTPGESCSTVGLTCDHWSYGYVECTASGWVSCEVAHFSDHCPSTPPTEGDTCCVIVVGDPSMGDCSYGDSVWRCESGHWTQQP